MSYLVVDASVAVKWFVLEAGLEPARRVLQSDYSLLAPRLILTEVANALAQKVIQKIVSLDVATENIEALPKFLTRLLDVDDLIGPALQNACDFRHPIYDFIYLEAARRWETQVLTADQRFAAKVSATALAKYVTLLSEWKP